jgi:hypothetical protein
MNSIAGENLISIYGEELVYISRNINSISCENLISIDGEEIFYITLPEIS